MRANKASDSGVIRDRLILTATWMFFFLVAVVFAIAYTEIPDRDGFLKILPEQRMVVLQPVLGLYGLYLGGIVLFWFLKPFPEFKRQNLILERVRFWLAIICTCLFNVAYVALIARSYFVPDANILEDMEQALQIAKQMSWIVAPVNAYYFGLKT